MIRRFADVVGVVDGNFLEVVPLRKYHIIRLEPCKMTRERYGAADTGVKRAVLLIRIDITIFSR